MGAFQRLAHGLHQADALEGIVRAAVGEIDEIGHKVALDLLRVDEVGHAEALGARRLGGVDIDADDHVGAGKARALDDGEADAAEPEHHDIGARLDPGRVEHRAQARGDAAADQADLVERRVLADLRRGDLRHHRVVGEGRGAHIVEQPVAADGEAAGAVRHQALALGLADRDAEIGLAGEAEFAMAAFRRVERNHMVAGLERGDAGAGIDDHARSLMAQNGGKQPLRVCPGERVGIGMANAGRPDLHQDLALAGAVEFHGFDAERLAGFQGYGGAGLHGRRPPLDDRRPGSA